MFTSNPRHLIPLGLFLVGALLLTIDTVECHKRAKLEIMPLLPIQRNPVGKSLMLTCRSDVDNPDLITDLDWKDNQNMSVYRKLNKNGPQQMPPVYSEFLPSDQSLALFFQTLTEGMAGTYTCTASYTNNLLTSSVVIETYVPITWKDAPLNQYPIQGSDFTVRCEVSASPSPKVDWLRNGDTLTSGDRYVIETHGLRIRNVEESDDGIYTCRAVVIDTGELVERNIRVEVQVKPHVLDLPKVIEAVEGQSFSIICNATGKPVPEYTWVRAIDQQNLENEDRFNINKITGQMNILRVIKEDYGSYKCIATNAAGVHESQMLLNVLVVPKIYELINITRGVEEEATLRCKATGRPPPYITFRRWGSQEELTPGPQANDDRVILDQDFNDDLGEAQGILTITKLVRPDDGLYECVARNKGDTAYKVGHIAVEFPPNFDHMKNLPPVYTWEERRANLSCLAQSIPNATIEWRRDDRLIQDLFDVSFKIESQGPRSDLLITPRGPSYFRSYRCIASNRYGRAEHIMELKEGHIPGAVPQAIPKVVTATTVTFEIMPPPADPGMPIKAYSVQWVYERDRDWNNAFNRTWSPDSPYIVEGLMPQTSYNFRFAARNLRGLGPWGAYRLQGTPKRSAPEVPRTLHSPIEDTSEDGSDPIVISPYADHFELRWNVPADNGELIDSYQVRYCPGVKVNGAWSEFDHLCVTKDVHSTETTHYDMNDLKAGTYYRIELRAHNAMGFSAPMNLLLKTARGADVVLRVDETILSSGAIVGIAVGAVLIALLIIDFLCCVTKRTGILATLTRKTKRSPSDLDDEQAKLGSGSLVKEPPPSPLPLPPPVMRLGGTPLTTPQDETAPLHTPPMPDPYKNHSSVDFDGRVVHSRSGDIIGKNSAV